MAARRGKSQARRHGSSGLPGWAWLVVGILVTLLVVLAAPRLLAPEGSDGFLRIGPKPNPDARPVAASEDGEAIAPDLAGDAPPAAEKPAEPAARPQYDFYTLLPGEEVAVSDAELAASARAEADAQARAARQAAAGEDPAALPASIADATPTTPATPASEPAGPPAAPAVATAPPAPAAAEARYSLQAGAFGASGDAEALKAKIALLGLNARVESAQIGGKTVYRVRMGPYGSASELAEAKAKLTGGGLPAMAVKSN